MSDYIVVSTFSGKVTTDLLLLTAGTGIEASWAGGEDGRQVIDLFLPLIDVRAHPDRHN